MSGCVTCFPHSVYGVLSAFMQFNLEWQRICWSKCNAQWVFPEVSLYRGCNTISVIMHTVLLTFCWWSHWSIGTRNFKSSGSLSDATKLSVSSETHSLSLPRATTLKGSICLPSAYHLPTIFLLSSCTTLLRLISPLVSCAREVLMRIDAQAVCNV